MPQVKDASVVASGFVFGVEPVSKFDGSGQPDGAKVTLSCGDGMLVIKVKQDFVHVIQPQGSQVAWLVRQAPYAIDGNSGMSTQFVRELNVGDLDAIHSIVNQKATASK